jgi:hypothetical protein
MTHLQVSSATWPLDADGNPMTLVSFRVEEKIGLPNYSNVTLEAAASRLVKDTDEAVKEGYARTTQQVEDVCREQRQIILNIVKKQTA